MPNTHAWLACAIALFAACDPRATPAVIEDPALPGIGAPSARLAAELAGALTRHGPTYRPHTRHLAPDGTPKFTNRLILETSPYLLQHAHNPVNWYAWSDEAFERARREGKLVFLSIGYSTCHWCHVMERESFEDEAVARYLNENYVCIKVDREERPDLDDVYMKAVQALTGSGGWPMSVFLTPDRAPFFGGTYLPRDRLLAVLHQLQELHARAPLAIFAEAGRAVAALQPDTTWMRGAAPPPQVIAVAIRGFADSFDATWGGFGDGPKFPRPEVLDLLLRYHRRTGDVAALRMVTVTLEQMAAGGIHDHVAGGFHRYATDRQWRVPHFEKMLYDQAQLATIYLDAAQALGRADFADVARGTLDYLLREMQAPAGGFYAATDADSPSPSGGDEEGLYFTWTRAELDAALGAELGSTVATYYGVLPERSILHVVGAPADVAARLGVAPDQLEADIRRARELMAVARARRPPPRRDDKIVVAWNGLAITALARGAIVLDRPDYAAAAARAATRLVDRVHDPGGRLARSITNAVVGPRGGLGDHVLLIEGLLDLHEADGDPRWLDDALAIQRALDRDFADPAGGYFATARDGEAELARDKPTYDGAEPSGNAVALANLVRLAEITGDETWRQRAEAGFAAFSVLLGRDGTTAPRMLSALEALHDRSLEIALVAPSSRDELASLLAVIRRAYVPNRVLATTVAGPALDALARRLPWLEGKRALGGRATAFVCEHAACKAPTSDPDELARQLREVHPLAASPPVAR